MYKIALFSFIALSLYANADEVAVSNNSSQMNYNNSQTNYNNNNSQMTNNSTSNTNFVTLNSAVPDSSNGWYIFADALYWHADVDAADWAFKNTNTDAVITAGANHTLEFKWNYGFRVGLGANMDFDQWDTNLYYTWFQTSNSNAVGTTGSQNAWDEFGLATEFTQGKIHWRVHYQNLDWELGRWFYVSRNLALRPHIGLKSAWIRQRVGEHFTKLGGVLRAQSSTNNFWGVGPCGGLNTTWTFATVNTHNFSFFGDFAGALMYGHFRVKHNEVSTVTGSTTPISGFKPSGLNRNLMVPMMQGMFGLSWDTSFNRNRCHFGLRVGYELQYWFRQNQMLINEAFPAAAVTDVIAYQRANGALALQGLTFDLRFDF